MIYFPAPQGLRVVMSVAYQVLNRKLIVCNLWTPSSNVWMTSHRDKFCVSDKLDEPT